MPKFWAKVLGESFDRKFWAVFFLEPRFESGAWSWAGWRSWAGLGWAGLGWAGLSWAGRAGLAGRGAGLGWAGLDWAGCAGLLLGACGWLGELGRGWGLGLGWAGGLVGL